MTKKRTMNIREAKKRAAQRKTRMCARKQPERYTYIDCLRDEAPVPTGVNGTTLYQTLMVGSMVTVVTTANGIRDLGIGFFENPH